MKTFLSAVVTLALSPAAFASFHLMQIEQVIGALDGDTTAQAIQLRMRSAGENLVSNARVRAWDATGANPVLVMDMTTNVTNSAAGSRVLLATAAFITKLKALAPAFAPDFTITNPIPASYLAAGRLTYEDNIGNVYWSLAWGGAAYAGSNAGSILNDADGIYGPPFARGLPTVGRQGPLFQGVASAASTSNAADYALSLNPATVVGNNGTAYLTGTLLTALETWRNTWFGTTANSGNAADNFDFDNDGLVNLLEYAFGLNPKDGASCLIPQAQLVASNLVISFSEPPGVDSITYGAEWSTSLAPLDWHPVTDTGVAPQHIFSVPTNGNPALFMRLKVTGP